MLAVLALIAAACGGTADDTTPPDDSSVTTTAAPVDAGQTDGESTLDVVKNRGTLRCGVSGSAVAFSETQPDGSVTGFDADFCRALAAAVLGDANAIEFRALTAQERFDALSSGEIDVLMRNTTWTQSRDTEVGMDFAPTTYYDGQQLMGRSEQFSASSTLADVDGAILCTNAGTTTEKNITEGAQVAGATIQLETVETFPEAMEKFKAGTCDLVTTDGSGLVGNKATAVRDGEITEDEWVIFPTAPISKEPLGPVYRQNDSTWADVVNWTVYATIIADEKGITQANVEEMMEVDPEAARLFGGEGELQTAMGLDAEAFLNVIKQVGSYTDIYNRNLNPVGLFREGSFNAPFNQGGLIYAPPAR
ncbi:MAG: amino acid ABC transporter substrate-binding protein [Acidimicrobiia bacterium]|nr:amino acid ABC transporter substrate-binding protein [Acidimicrobiia bacterium]NNF63586.1 amino acid ABC transporter substrate-binding protein [Acidimicrobiia bacterium]